MAEPLSLDLRLRIVAAYEPGETTYEDIAERFDVGYATVSRLLTRQRRTGSVEPDPPGGGNPPAIPHDELSVLHALVEDDPSQTQAELAEAWFLKTGRRVSRASVGRALKRADITNKKSSSSRGSSSAQTLSKSGERSSFGSNA